MRERCLIMLENNPEVMNHLAQALGLSPSLSFHDIYSLTDPELISLIPRPVHALLVIIPLTPTWDAIREAEDADKPEYTGKGASEPVLWFKQTIGHTCGSVGLLHCIYNTKANEYIEPGSTLDQIRKEALYKSMCDRAKVLEDSAAFERAHLEAAQLGDTPVLSSEAKNGQHFVAFVKAEDGHLWELEGVRKGPLDRGVLGPDEDVLSAKAVELGLGRLMKIESGKGGDLRFSAIALAG